MVKVLALATLVAGGAFAQETQSAPETAPTPALTQVIITYRSPPPRRAAFRQYMTEFGMPRLEQWKQDGIFKDFKLLFNWYVDSDTWDAMAILTFPDYTQLAKWKNIEKTNPGGLARDALDLAWPLNTYATEILASGSSEQPQDAAQSVYFVVPYDNVNGDFRTFVSGNLDPQGKKWMSEGVLASYKVYQNRYPGGKRWLGLAVYEYKDVDTFERAHSKPLSGREPVIADAMLP